MSLLANDKMRLIVTGKCNLDCFYCHNEGQAKEDSFASVEDVRKIVDAVVMSGTTVNEITVSGGEPLLHPRIEEIVGIARESRARVTMVSNGLLATSDMFRSLSRRGLTKFRLGVDSLLPVKPRPSPGFLPEPFSAAAVLSAAAAAGLSTDLNAVVTRFNRRGIVDLIAFAVEHAASIKFFEHVDVVTYGGDGRGGRMVSAPQVTFAEFRDAVNDYAGRTIRFRPDPLFGESNLTTHLDDIEIRYCRYLCDYGVCWLTGTRVDARRYAYNCMSNRGLDRLVMSSPVTIAEGLSAATKRSCRSTARGAAE